MIMKYAYGKNAKTIDLCSLTYCKNKFLSFIKMTYLFDKHINNESNVFQNNFHYNKD